MASRQKWYVVWVGTEPGICESWEECELRVKGYPGARYKSYDDLEDAITAYRRGADNDMGIIRALAQGPKCVVNYDAIPEILPGSVAVDAACSGNPGHMEYQGVEIHTGLQIFHKKFAPLATNNIGEFLAIVHALALYHNDPHKPAIYSDSRTAIAWVRDKKCKTKIKETDANRELFDVIRRAERWLQNNAYGNRIIKWETDKWGEIPADFGRK
ncbi:MAG: viroplasmin family protein [Muribaculaceae bacterium]